MIAEPLTDISTFFVAGINYRKSDASIRGQFSINAQQYQQLISSASSFHINNLFVLSTCNRTEIYGFADNALSLAKLLCTHTEGSLEDFSEMSYSKKGVDAIEHLFHVAAGLDSQILGDYEIVGQIKTAVKFSKEHLYIDTYLDRIINEVLAASKNIRTHTQLSSGTVSVSFAAVQYIRQYFKDASQKNILLIGTGKIGMNTFRNISDYLPGAKVTLVNRSEDKAEALAKANGAAFDSLENLSGCIRMADVIIVATNAAEPIVHTHHFEGAGDKLVIDLSVPFNVAAAVQQCMNVQLVNIDELSKINDETLQKRAAEIPKVKAIIGEHIADFLEWHQMRKHVPVLKKVKNHLLKIQSCDATGSFSIKPLEEEKIQKVINGMAVKMRTQNQRGCNYIEAMNDYIATASN
jgi:glutamyl-tRNA reductase